MKITNVEVTRKFNLGNYETQDIKLAAEVDDLDDVDDVIKSLKGQIKVNQGK